MSTMLPEMAADLQVSVPSVSTSLSAYLLPFAAAMLVSGTLAERLGRRRTVQVGYIVYALSSIGCALAPNLQLFLLLRVVQGVSNAFTTPVLAAAITDQVPPQRLGRSLGMFGATQAVGQAMSLLLGGLAASFRWQSAFIVIGVLSAVLALLPPADAPARADQRPGRWRALATRQLLVASTIALLAFLTTIGMAVVGALYVRDEYHLSPFAAGLVVASFGVAGLATGRWSGSLLDRHPRLLVGSAAHALLGGLCVLAGLSTLAGPVLGLVLAVVLIALAGVASAAARSMAQTLSVTAAPENRSGASSVMLACQYTGGALVPFTWVPIYHLHTATNPHLLALSLAGVSSLVAGALLLVLGRRGFAASPAS